MISHRFLHRATYVHALFYFFPARNRVGKNGLGMKPSRKEVVLVAGLLLATLVFLAASAVTVAGRF
ncbi:MAG: hypothetical protein K2X07_05095 [Caulobacteraceae bacterium]|nr:hypothetical protein [Caulobacteraceae bacterium]